MVSLLALLFFLVGLSLAALGITSAVGGRSGWPIAKGTVARGEILEIDGHYMGVVRYIYALQAVSAYRGAEHQMEGRLESPPCASRNDAEAHLLKYPVGDRIDVRYDPARPTRSMLGPVPQAQFARWLGILGLTLSFVSAVVALSP